VLHQVPVEGRQEWPREPGARAWPAQPDGEGRLSQSVKALALSLLFSLSLSLSLSPSLSPSLLFSLSLVDGVGDDRPTDWRGPTSTSCSSVHSPMFMTANCLPCSHASLQDAGLLFGTDDGWTTVTMPWTAVIPCTALRNTALEQVFAVRIWTDDAHLAPLPLSLSPSLAALLGCSLLALTAWTTQINQRAVGIPMPEPEPEQPSSSAQPAGVTPEKLRTVSVQCVSVMSSARACLSAADGSASEVMSRGLTEGLRAGWAAGVGVRCRRWRRRARSSCCCLPPAPRRRWRRRRGRS
jgi:hypothetical protein